MSSFAWMRFLESSPRRYDRGIEILSGGRIGDVYRDIARRVAAPGRRILDVGCGTGGASLACAALGAQVTGIDINAGMLEIAREKPVPAGGSVEWLELGAAEIEDRFAPGSLDAVIACLSFSELSDDEQAYTLRTAHGCLVPGGQIVIADETLARNRGRRLWQGLRRWPRHALTYLIAQQSTRPLADPTGKLRDAGFVDVGETRMWSDTFAIVWGRKPS